MMDFLLRAKDRATFDTVAAKYGILVNGQPAPGVYLDHIGPHVREPAILDANGNVITPAVIDNRYHVNMRITEPALSTPDAVDPSKGKWQALRERWKTGLAGKNNAGEKSWSLEGVELVEAIADQSRVWL